MEERHVVVTTSQILWIFYESECVRMVDNGQKVIVFADFHFFVNLLQRKVVLDLLQTLLVLLPITDGLVDSQSQKRKHSLIQIIIVLKI